VNKTETKHIPLVLAESMVMLRWENELLNNFLNYSLKMMLSYQTSMLLLATGMSVRMLNSRDRKKE
jgi:hypothetical protein